MPSHEIKGRRNEDYPRVSDDVGYEEEDVVVVDPGTYRWCCCCCDSAASVCEVVETASLFGCPIMGRRWGSHRQWRPPQLVGVGGVFK
jgi:hypothetical protein